MRALRPAAAPGAGPAEPLAPRALWADDGPKVLMTVDAVGGVWRYAMDLAAALAGRVAFVFAGFGPPPPADQRDEARALGTLEWAGAPLDWLAADEAELAAVPHEIATLARRHRVDLVHLNLPSQAAGLSLPVPVVAVAHSCVVTWFAAVRGVEPPEGWRWQRRRNARGLTAADLVVTLSQAHADLMRAAYGIAGIRVVANASRFEPGPGAAREPFVLAAGRWWDEGKNAAVLDAAAPAMDWPLRMAGGLRSPSGGAATIGNAEALGDLPHAEVLDLMRRASAFVAPSRYEPFGLAVLEAARAGLPLLLSDIPTFRELWEGAATFFPPDDPAALAAQANRLARAPAEARRLGEAARRRARRFTPERQAAEMLRLYSGCLAATGTPCVAR